MIHCVLEGTVDGKDHVCHKVQLCKDEIELYISESCVSMFYCDIDMLLEGYCNSV